MTAAIDVHALGEADWQLLKSLRLSALRDSPDAFGPAVSEVEDEPDSYWQAAARRFAAPDEHIFVARAGGIACGLISALVDAARDGQLGALWVAPAQRGTRAGAALFEHACAWLPERGCRRLVLHVTNSNTRAHAWYTRRGFVETGATEALRAGSPLLNVEMVRTLNT